MRAVFCFPLGVRYVCLLCSVLLAACAATPQRTATSKSRTIWPAPPDLPRFAYETVLRSAADITSSPDDGSRLLRELSGTAPSTNPAYEKPGAVAARNGSIYVADLPSKTIVVFDVPRQKLFRFGWRQPGTLAQPVGLALDEQMNVYVADAKRHQVLVYDKLGLFQRAVGGLPDLERPTGVAVSRDGERIYAIDRSNNESDNHRVVVYDRDGRKLKVIGQRGPESGQFNVPLQGAVSPDGTLYVLDSGNFRVQAFDRDGNFLRAFGSAGINLGNLARPRGIAVDDDGNVYVTDASFNNFQVFDPQGNLLLTVGTAGNNNAPGQYGLLGSIAVDETGRVYVADQLFNKVEVIRRLSEGEGQGLLRAALDKAGTSVRSE